jgi:hypothetical protein
MSTITYLDGSQLTSTALTDLQIQTAFQIATAQMLGIVIFASPMALSKTSNIATPQGMGNLAAGQYLTSPNIPEGTTIVAVGETTITMSQAPLATLTDSVVVSAPGAAELVRIGWQQEGQPGWGIDGNYVMLRCAPIDTEYGRMRDVVGAAGETTITQTDVYTRTWKAYWTFYGPSALDNARAVRSALITIQFVSDLLEQSNLYLNPSIDEPQRVPENFQGQWWDRVDMVAQFNEQVTETFTVGIAKSVQVSLYTDAGQFEEFTTEV